MTINEVDLANMLLDEHERAQATAAAEAEAKLKDR